MREDSCSIALVRTLMAEDRFKAQARAILEGCPFNMEDAIAADLREADLENAQLRRELSWALDMLERQSDSDEVRQRLERIRRSLAESDKR